MFDIHKNLHFKEVDIFESFRKLLFSSSSTFCRSTVYFNCSNMYYFEEKNEKKKIRKLAVQLIFMIGAFCKEWKSRKPT